MASSPKTPLPDNFDPLDDSLTDEEVARLRPASEWFTAQGLPMPSTRGRGRPKKDQPKISVTMRLDATVIEGFKRHGRGWQTRMGDVLADSLSQTSEQPLAAARRLAVQRMVLEKARRRQKIRARVPRRAAARISA